MSVLGFKPQFAGPVERREKRQTIRAKMHGHQIGRPIQLYTGLRTKACRKLVADDPVCTSIDPIKIDGDGVFVRIGDQYCDRGDEILKFAQADGFADLGSFFEFFRQEDGKPFHGFLIRWDWP